MLLGRPGYVLISLKRRQASLQRTQLFYRIIFAPTGGGFGGGPGDGPGGFGEDGDK